MKSAQGPKSRMLFAGVTLHLLAAGALCGASRVATVARQPLGSDDRLTPLDAEPLNDASPDYEEDGGEEDGLSLESQADGPSQEDYVALRQRNAELALQLEELTSEMGQLQHEQKMTRWRTKFAMSNIHRHCHHHPRDRASPAHAMQADSGSSRHMPWLLTHTGTRHRYAREDSAANFPGGEGLFSGVLDFFRGRLPSAVPTVQTAQQLVGEKEQWEHANRDIGELNAHLKDTRKRLGQNEEARRALEARVRDLTPKIGMQQNNLKSEDQKLVQDKEEDGKLAKEIQAEDQAIHNKAEALNGNVASQELGMDGQKYVTQEAMVSDASESLHEEVEQRIEDSQKALDAMKASNSKLQKQIESEKQREQAEQAQVVEIQRQSTNITTEKEELEEQDKLLEKKEAEAETKRASEETQLMSSAGQQARCMEWGNKLEAKLKHVLGTKEDDAKMCHDGILGLHRERMKLKEANVKSHTELKKMKKRTEEATRQGDETLSTLNSCLSQLHR